VTHQNVQSSLATTLHEVSVSFRKDQKKYLEKLRDNEAKSRYKPTLNHTEEEFEDTGLSQAQMAEYVSSYCYMSPHTAVHVSSYWYICVLVLLHVSSYYYMHRVFTGTDCGICVLVLLYMSPHTAVYVFSYFYMCPQTAIYVYFTGTDGGYRRTMCPRTTTYVSSY
jgi:hypothetical protein